MKNRSNRIRTKYERIGSALIHLLFIFICHFDAVSLFARHYGIIYEVPGVF